MTETDWPHIVIYTDGGCNPNPGPGGWGAVILRESTANVELSGGEPETTNNRMELTAAMAALESLTSPHQVDLYTDSRYLRQGVVEWLPRWQANHWRNSAKSEVKNRDLWSQLARQLERHRVSWHWTKGHAGDQWNERADELASASIQKPPLPLDDRDAIHVFCAAAYVGKAKKGGWAILLRYRNRTKTMSGTATKTTANRMHIQSAIEGLRAIKRRFPVHLYTTSDYLKNGATLWYPNWVARNWRTREGKPVSNRELWEVLAELLGKHQVTPHVVARDELPDEMKQAKQLASGAAHTA